MSYGKLQVYSSEQLIAVSSEQFIAFVEGPPQLLSQMEALPEFFLLPAKCCTHLFFSSIVIEQQHS